MAKILIVDDEEKIRYIVRKMLEGEGYEVIEAEGGKECLEILKNDRPDLILMDVMMPEMDGWETASAVKRDENNKGIIISMLTVKSEDEDKIKSLDEASADWHIAKPIKRDKLVQTIGWLLTKPLK
ncbi:response regulator [archaeon]|nr:response regulator [archaeon]